MCLFVCLFCFALFCLSIHLLYIFIYRDVEIRLGSDRNHNFPVRLEHLFKKIVLGVASLGQNPPTS